MPSRLRRAAAAVRDYPLSHTLAALLGIILAAGVTIAVEPGTHRVTIHVGGPTTTQVKVIPPAPTQTKVDNADVDAKPDNTVTLTPKAQDVEQTLAVGAAKGTNDLKPREAPSLPPLSGTVTGPIAQLEAPFASDSIPGCRTRFLTTNWSARAPGIRVGALALHYTAGPDIPGSRSEVDGLTAFGNRPSSAVSWAANLDKDGNCDYNVPYRYKAWTIAGLNSATVDYEIAGRGDAPYLRPAGYRELARLWIDFHRRYPYIPLRLGATDGHCNITRTGIITHWMGGPCSGGHIDINPLSITGVIAELARYVAQAEQANCDHRTACKMGRRHAAVHAQLRDECGHATTPPCQRLRARNQYMHRYARAHHLTLVTQ